MRHTFLVLFLGIILGATCAQQEDSAATAEVSATQDGNDQPSAVVLPVLHVREDSDQKVTVGFVNSGEIPINYGFLDERHPIFCLYFALFQDGEQLNGFTVRYSSRAGQELRTLKPGDSLDHVVSLPYLASGRLKQGRYLLTASYYWPAPQKSPGVTPMKLEQKVAIIEVTED